MWKIQQAMQDDAIRTIWTHPAFIPVTCLKCSYGKISSPLTEISRTEPACPLIKTHRTSYKGFRGKGDISETGPAGDGDGEGNEDDKKLIGQNNNQNNGCLLFTLVGKPVGPRFG